MEAKEKINAEVKIKVDSLEPYRKKLQELGAELKGIDNQKDIYFKVKKGRLKLRTGTIENALIYYNRTDQSYPKKSEIILFRNPPESLKTMLFQALETLVVVEKTREIYFLENVKFHLDSVPSLGFFVEIEVMGDLPVEYTALKKRLEELVEIMGLPLENRVEYSYSDLLLPK